MKKINLVTGFLLAFFSLDIKAYETTIKCPDLETSLLFKNDVNCLISTAEDGYCYSSENDGAFLKGQIAQTYESPDISEKSLSLTWVGKTSYPDLSQQLKNPKGTFDSNSVLPDSPSSLVCTYNVSGLAKADLPFNLYASLGEKADCKAEKGVFHCSTN